MQQEFYSKQELRKAILARILKQKEEDAFFKSRVICEKFLALSILQEVKTILCYAAVKGEVDTFGLINRLLALDKKLALPYIDKRTNAIYPIKIRSLNELTKGSFGILEPVFKLNKVLSTEEIDLIVVPGIAFDKNFERLGRGAGYYDRFLSSVPEGTPLIGLAYDLQLVDRIPGLASHDRPVTMVLTN